MDYEQYVMCGACGQNYRLGLYHRCQTVAKVIDSLEGMLEPGPSSTVYSLQRVIEDLAERVKLLQQQQNELTKAVHDLIKGINELL